MKTRIIYSDNGALTDLTAQLNNYNANTQALSIVAAEDSILLGSIYPFTSKYFKNISPNSTASTLTISYWDGTVWRAASDYTDETGLAGTPFANSGCTTFSTDKRYPWASDDTTSNGLENITGFGINKNIYDMYWVRLTYSANISVTLSWIGDVYCTDSDLQSVAPAVVDTTFMDDWESGKSDWEDQRVIATKLLIEEMKGINLDSENLFLDKDELTMAATFRTLAVIYGEMGDVDRFNMYMARVDVLVRQSFTKDKNLDGRANPNEVGLRETTFKR